MLIKIGNRLVGDDYPCFIVVEAGLNHNGDISIAKQLIDLAVSAKADAVKFQKRTIDKIMTKEMLNMPYVNYWSYGTTYGEHRKKLELSDTNYYELFEYCNRKGIIFLASAWDEMSVDFLEKLGVPAFKVGSPDLTNLPLLEYIAQKEKPILLSTGMANMVEVELAVKTTRKHNDQLVLLQCTSTYPSDFEDVNLRVMRAYRDKYNVLVGFSGHERGIATTEAAVCLGACVVERHFTLDCTMKGPDHAASLEPTGLIKLIRDIRVIEKAMGKAEKKILEKEIPIRNKLSKSIVAKKKIRKGEMITRDNLIMKSPGTGISPIFINKVVGKIAKQDIEEDTLLLKEALSW